LRAEAKKDEGGYYLEKEGKVIRLLPLPRKKGTVDDLFVFRKVAKK